MTHPNESAPAGDLRERLLADAERLEGAKGVTATRDLLREAAAALSPAIAPAGDARTVRLDLSVFDQPGDPRNNLIAAGWTPPGIPAAGAVDDAMVERATKAYCAWFGTISEGVNTLALRAALTAALNAAQEDKS